MIPHTSITFGVGGILIHDVCTMVSKRLHLNDLFLQCVRFGTMNFNIPNNV